LDPGNRRAIFAALFANLGLAVAKFVAWLLTGAASMLAEAFHSLADSTNQGLLLWGGAAAAREPTPSHPFGHGRERYFWAFVVAIVIFTLGGLFALYEGVSKLLHPHSMNSPMVAISVLVLGLALEGASLRTAIREAKRYKGTQTWWRYIRNAKEPELPVVLLEDLGALLGLVFALIGVTVATLTGNGAWDAIGSIAIGALLIGIAAVLSIEMKSLLIGEAASPEDCQRITAAMESVPAFRRLIHMRTQHIGPDELLVGAKVEFDSALGFAAISDVIDDVEHAIRERVPIARVIYIEPDLYDSAQADEARSVE
jgi:cation diffusion facilitator family transporter